MRQYREEIRRIMLAVNTIDGIYALEARKIGLKENALSLFYALDDGKAHTQKQICEEWLIPKTTINTIVKECINAGYITLEAGEHTKEKWIRLTDEGQSYAKGVLEQVYSVEHSAMKKTLEQFTVEFANAMEHFTDNLHEEFKKHFMEES